jgi:Lon protease-like protein
LYDVGCVAVIRRVEQTPDGRFALVTIGSRRFRIQGVDESRPYLQADVEWLDEPAGDGPTAESLAHRVRLAFDDYRAALGGPDVEIEFPEDATAVSYVIAATAMFALPERQELLEATDTCTRLKRELDLLNRELGLVRTLRTVPITPSQLPRSSQN